jgi:hypothetical protein
MSKRKPIYFVRMATRVVTLTGSLTIEASPSLTDTQRREAVEAIVRKLRSIGIEASPKQPEIHR